MGEKGQRRIKEEDHGRRFEAGTQYSLSLFDWDRIFGDRWEGIQITICLWEIQFHL